MISNFFRFVLGASDYADDRSSMPPRIMAALNRYDDISEMLVKIIQIIVFGIFLILYFLSPLTNPNSGSQLPAVLSIYICVSLAILINARFNSIPSSVIYTSIFLDMALLTYLMWTYHIQYSQPPAFSLKAPTFMVYFILIGVRALRFDARYVLAAGFSSIFCWLCLVIYVISSYSSPPFTRSFVSYLSGNNILPGAEIVRVVFLLMFTLTLALAVRRAYIFLLTSVFEGQAAADLSRFMPTDVATQIRSSGSDIVAGAGERLDVCIVNIDIRGFSKMVEDMDPADAMGILSDYQHCIVPIVHRHGGTIDKYMGDGIMVTFGASSSDAAYCSNALQCCYDILDSHSAWNGKASDIAVNLALTSGEVIYGPVGVGDRLEYTVIGATVNRSAKLEKLNKHFSSLGICDLRTYDLAKSQGFVERETPTIVNTAVEGTQHPIDIVLLGTSKSESDE